MRWGLQLEATGIALLMACNAIASGVASGATEGGAEQAVPIIVGGLPAGNNCTSNGVQTGVVMPLRPGAYLSVRAAPDIKARELDRLVSDHLVLVCTGPTKRDWVGIIYWQHGDDELFECGLDQTHPTRRSRYQGPCRWGWVARRYLLNPAG